MLHSRSVRLLLLCCALVSASSSCGEDAGGDACDALPGELVISELLANPVSGSKADEWLELYNASSRPVATSRLIFSVAGSGEPEQFVVQDGPIMAPGQYVVFGGAEQPHVDFDYRESFELANGGGLVQIACKTSLVDEISYGARGGPAEAEQGYSVGMDGGVAPDALLNDDGAWWCSGGGVYDGVNVGTPGARNDLCGFSRCAIGDEERAVLPPRPGDLVISELLTNPAYDDEGKEWLEVYVAATEPVHLNAVRVEATSASGASTYVAELVETECITAQPGTFVVLGATNDPELNGGVTVDVVLPGLGRGSGFFFNSAHTVRLARMGVVLDEAVAPAGVVRKAQELHPTTNLPVVVEYAFSSMLDQGSLHVQSNDDMEAFCVATSGDTGYYAHFGTPGGPNRLCGRRTCRDGEFIRDVVSPEAGDLVLSEVLADAGSVADGAGELLEIYVATEGVDLNGLVIRNAGRTNPGAVRSTTVAAPNCLRFPRGEHVVIGQGYDEAANGHAPVDAVAELSFYNNTDLGLVVELLAGDVVVDAATLPPVVKGRTASVHPELLTAAGNDDPSAWCLSTTVGVFDDVGTPGLANVCGPSCLDQGVPTAVGTLRAGDLVITEVLANPDGADDCNEWVEVYAPGDVIVAGLRLDNDSNPDDDTPATRSWLLSGADGACVGIAGGSYALFAGPAAPVAPSDVALTLACAGSATPPTMFYSSVGSQLSLVSDEVVVDAARYASPTGLSWSLSPAATSALANDEVGNWCEGPGAAPAGTPGVANHVCAP